MAETGASEKLKVFVSYSRHDGSDFAEEIVGGLALAGFAAFLDRHDIVAGEDWEARLSSLILRADTVVFLVSPEAVKSEHCAWEVNTALANAKRVLPVIFKPVPDSDIPEQLRRRQFVRFDTAPGITRPLAELAEALRQDLDWIREHTRIGEAAARWGARGRPESLLLRGDDLVAAQSWAAHRNPDAPAITEQMRAFITASKDAEAASLAKSNAAQRRIIRMQSLVTVLLVGVIIGLMAWINQSQIAAQWRWWTVTRPYARAQVEPHVLSATQVQALKAGDVFRECAALAQNADDCPDMVVVPAGSFLMGSSNAGEQPQRQVTLAKPFAVSKFELTFAEWDTCVAHGDCARNPADSGWGRGEQPVINVSWADAQQYIGWLSKVTGRIYRLLSEAEYEYAARAGTTTAYPWGDQIGNDKANCDGCGSSWDNRQAAPVGSFNASGFVGTFAANAFGLNDMVGNVWEWVQDCFQPNYQNAATDGTAWTSPDCPNHVIRGGSWNSPPNTLRSASRAQGSIDARVNNVGFRVARTLHAP